MEMLPELPSMMITTLGMKMSLLTLTHQQSLEKACHHMRTLLMININRTNDKSVVSSSTDSQHIQSDTASIIEPVENTGVDLDLENGPSWKHRSGHGGEPGTC